MKPSSVDDRELLKQAAKELFVQKVRAESESRAQDSTMSDAKALCLSLSEKTRDTEAE